MPVTFDVAKQVAQSFCQFYFQSLQGNRNALAQVYAPNSTLVYNGQPLNGIQQIGERLMQLAFRSVKIDNVQVMAAPCGEGVFFLTSGIMTPDEEPAGMPFTQSGLLMPTPNGSYFIQSEIFQVA